jgi:hypothetical protein
MVASCSPIPCAFVTIDQPGPRRRSIVCVLPTTPRRCPRFIVEHEPQLAPLGTCASAATTFSMCLYVAPDTSTGFQVVNVPLSATRGYTLISTSPATPTGSGAFFGIVLTASVWNSLFMVPIAGEPLAWLAGPASEASLFPNAPYITEPGFVTMFSGQTWDVLAIAFDPVFNLVGVSPVLTVSW